MEEITFSNFRFHEQFPKTGMLYFFASDIYNRFKIFF
jgi:uncharacterized protein YwqG